VEPNSENLEEALEAISNALYGTYKELVDGMPGGSYEEWGYDEQLAIEIGQAVDRWRNRKSNIQDPFVVSLFNGTSWSRVTEDMYQEDAYKEWYRLTNGGKTQAGPKDETYYYLGSSKEELDGRHRIEKEEDGFSINYLLEKSFGK